MNVKYIEERENELNLKIKNSQIEIEKITNLNNIIKKIIENLEKKHQNKGNIKEDKIPNLKEIIIEIKNNYQNEID